MADPRSFQTDLNQLAEAADVKLPELNELLHRQITALGAYSGVSGPTRTCGADSAFFSLTREWRAWRTIPISPGSSAGF